MHKRLSWLGIAGLFLAWPIFVDQAALSCWFSPTACSQGSALAFGAKVVSLLLGGFFASLLFAPKELTGWTLRVTRIVIAIALAAFFYLVTFIADFSRDFTF